MLSDQRHNLLLVTLFNYNYHLTGPISKYSHPRAQGLNVNLGRCSPARSMSRTQAFSEV